MRLDENAVRALLHMKELIPVMASALAELSRGKVGTKPGRRSEDEITLFKSVGVAIEDIAAADLVHRKAAQAIR